MCAQKRMFSLHIVDSDAFLEMPASTQNLYFHLCMRADDDGFVSNPKKIMKVVNCSEDDIKILFSKRFILGFDNGIIVIKHWKIHNYIAKDRYKETMYTDEKNKLAINDNGSYTDRIQIVDESSTQISIDKISIEKELYGELNNVLLTVSEYKRLIDDYGENIINKYINNLSLYEKINKYTDHNLTIRKWLNKDNVPKCNKIKISKENQIDLKEAWL